MVGIIINRDESPKQFRGNISPWALARMDGGTRAARIFRSLASQRS